MSETKLISVRVPADELEKLDELAKRFGNYKRSDLINAAIRLMVADDYLDFARKAIRYYPRYGDVIDKLEFEYHREHK